MMESQKQIATVMKKGHKLKNKKLEEHQPF